jgi:uncharacterized protein (UPF0335 family)
MSKNEEKPVKANTSGISQKKLKDVAANLSSSKAEMDTYRGEIGQLMKQFEEDGGNKAALKFALRLRDMETLKAQDLWRSLESYMEMLGIFDQHDLFDPVPGQDAAPVAAKGKMAAAGEAAIVH